jgi:hypothetical protein
MKGAHMGNVKYSVELYAVKDESDERGWYSMDLISDGSTLEELLDNAAYIMIDQDGGEVGQRPADDRMAVRLITAEYERQATEMQDPRHFSDPAELERYYEDED